MDTLRLLLRLYWQPGAAMSDVLDRGSMLFASLAVLVISFGAHFAFYMPLLILAAIYVPGLLLLTQIVAGLNGIFRRDYAPLLTCTAMAFAAAALPVSAAGWVRIPQETVLVLACFAALFFLFLMFFALRIVFGITSAQAATIAGFSWMPLVAAVLFQGPIRFVLGYLASPFFLFYAWYYLGGELGNLGSGLRRRQNFHRMLEAAAVNPHDGEAQYQLGLIYQQRRQYSEAIARFNKAIAIDPTQTDAHFQLGRIAREQGRLSDALIRFQTVVDQDPGHHQGEILRELGGLYLDAKQYSDAWRELGEYIERRPFDAEALYYAGKALEGLNNRAKSVHMYERTVEAAATAPRYLRRAAARWSRLAQKQLAKLAPHSAT